MTAHEKGRPPRAPNRTSAHRERHAAGSQRRRRRRLLLAATGATVAAAAIAVAVGQGSGNDRPAPSTAVAEGRAIERRLAGIPQDGVSLGSPRP